MEAGSLGCPMCGAPAARDATKCTHCGTHLATVSCPSCFGMIFEGSKFCRHCGTAVQRIVGPETDLPCPGCKSPLAYVHLGHTAVRECGKCHGLWVDTATFDHICTDKEKQSAVLGGASELYRPGEAAFNPRVRYVRCPECTELMHRVNFAKCSGIVIDVCKGHGSWFERDELQHIVQFIRTGGLELSRKKEKAEREEARRRIQTAGSLPSIGRSYTDQRVDLDFLETDLESIAGSLMDLFGP